MTDALEHLNEVNSMANAKTHFQSCIINSSFNDGNMIRKRATFNKVFLSFEFDDKIFDKR